MIPPDPNTAPASHYKSVQVRWGLWLHEAGKCGAKNCTRLLTTHHCFVPVMGDLAGFLLHYWVNRIGKLHWYHIQKAYALLDVFPPSLSYSWTSGHEQRVSEAWFSDSVHRVTGSASKRPQGPNGQDDGKGQELELQVVKPRFNQRSSDFICLMYWGAENEISGTSTKDEKKKKENRK